MGTLPTQTHRYAAFISYAHADEAMAARLHKALETYPVPKHLRAQGKATTPVFRDVAELTAAHSLSEKIRDAVKGSRVLIVLCSPAAKASHWVNEEIRLFRELHGDAAILSALLEGTPETSFPQALIEGGREPLAAALGDSRAGFKLGVTQLAAGILGTGLDDLVQRGAKRRQRIMGAGMTASLALSGVMGFATLQAVEARNEAESARGDAEGLVEYMIKDLKFKLEPVGRLDLLEGIGEKAVAYYDAQDIKDLPDDSLTRQAAARQVLAQVALDAGRMEEAQREIEASAALTREVLARNPDDTDAIFAHAQSKFWVGEYYSLQNNYDAVEKPWTEYNRLGQILYKKEPNNVNYIMEAAWGANNLGILHVKRNDYETAIKHLDASLKFFENAANLAPKKLDIRQAKVDALGWKADALEGFGPIQNALNVRDEQIAYIRNHPKFDSNYDLQFQHAEARFLSVRLAALKDEGEDVSDEFENVIRSLAALTNYDPDNIKWQITLLRVYVDYYYYADSEITKNSLARRLEKLQVVISKNMTDVKLLEFFYISLISSDSRGIELNLYSLWETAFSENSEEKAIVSSELIKPRINVLKLVERDMAANTVINYYENNSNKVEPKAIHRLVEAHLILKNCKAARKKASHLISRGYKAPSLSTCEG